MPMEKYEYLSDVWRDGIFGMYFPQPECVGSVKIAEYRIMVPTESR